MSSNKCLLVQIDILEETLKEAASNVFSYSTFSKLPTLARVEIQLNGQKYIFDLLWGYTVRLDDFMMVFFGTKSSILNLEKTTKTPEYMEHFNVNHNTFSPPISWNRIIEMETLMKHMDLFKNSKFATGPQRDMAKTLSENRDIFTNTILWTTKLLVSLKKHSESCSEVMSLLKQVKQDERANKYIRQEFIFLMNSPLAIDKEFLPSYLMQRSRRSNFEKPINIDDAAKTDENEESESVSKKQKTSKDEESTSEASK